MIRAVTVDWWHTLAEPHGGDWEPFAKRMRCEGIQRVLRERGIEVTYARLDMAYDLWTEHLARAWKRNEDRSEDEQVLELLACAGYDGIASPALVDDLAEPIGAPLLTRLPELHEGAAETLRALRDGGLKLGVVSNTGRTWGRFLRSVQERLGIGDLFDRQTFSDEERVRKPAAPIFERTLAGLKLRPEEVVHVGDDVDADVAGAQRLGMRAVWYDAGFWKGATAQGADAVIHRWRQLPDAIRGW